MRKKWVVFAVNCNLNRNFLIHFKEKSFFSVIGETQNILIEETIGRHSKQEIRGPLHWLDQSIGQK